MRVFLIASLLLALPLFPASAAESCGLAPAQPKLPAGCRAMEPTCVCDAKGCRWQFICVRQ